MKNGHWPDAEQLGERGEFRERNVILLDVALVCRNRRPFVAGGDVDVLLPTGAVLT